MLLLALDLVFGFGNLLIHESLKALTLGVQSLCDLSFLSIHWLHFVQVFEILHLLLANLLGRLLLLLSWTDNLFSFIIRYLLFLVINGT